jgi:outer membrane protein OmpA-like peptidoglycan-associated protein
MRTSTFFFGSSSALLLLLALPGTAYAQREGFAIDRFESAERGSQFFVVDNLDLRGAARPALGAVFDYGYKPLVAYDLNGNEKSAVVRHQAWVHLGGSLVLADRVRLALNVPVAVYQDGDATTLNGESFKPSDKPAIGDIRLAADFRLVGTKTDPFTLAVGVRAWLPTGPTEQFAGDGSFRIAPQIMAAGDLGVLTYAARLALVYRGRDESFGGTELGSEMVGAIGAGLKTSDGRFVIGPEIFASSVFSGTDTFFKTRTTPVEGLLGLHYDVVPDVRIGAGAGTGLTRGYGAPDFRGLLSFEYAPAYEKAEPAVVPPPPEPVVVPPADTDGDGVIDAEDACPTVPGPRSTNPKLNGCPDRDGDGVPDTVDACPDVAGVATDDPKTNGCPPDRDGDGILDAVDACPDLKGMKTEDPKTNGCPDTDGDGILDPEDACPKLPGPRNADPKRHGCPLVIVTEKEIKITEQVKFKFNSAELLKESDGILEAVREVLATHPEIVKVRVEGHTDNVGDAAYNKKLSGRRADSVMKWLTDHKIDKKRLVAAGFGMEEPIDVNTTDAGRANNRRVAFSILERDDSKKAPAAPAATPAPAPAPAPKP